MALLAFSFVFVACEKEESSEELVGAFGKEHAQEATDQAEANSEPGGNAGNEMGGEEGGAPGTEPGGGPGAEPGGETVTLTTEGNFKLMRFIKKSKQEGFGVYQQRIEHEIPISNATFIPATASVEFPQYQGQEFTYEEVGKLLTIRVVGTVSGDYATLLNQGVQLRMVGDDLWLDIPYALIQETLAKLDFFTRLFVSTYLGIQENQPLTVIYVKQNQPNRGCFVPSK